MSSETDYKAWRYQRDLPTDRENLEKAFHLLQEYSGIPADEVEPHVREVREQAYAVFPYACIGRWRFLDLYLTGVPEYPEIVDRIKAGDVFLDAGCCFGQILRQLAFDGAPHCNLRGADLRAEFVGLGYKLFRDKGRFGAKFFTGDILDASDASLDALDGTVDIIHAASLFHLFGWEDQLKLGMRIIRFLKQDAKKAVVLGRQVGNLEPKDKAEHTALGLGRYQHNLETWQALWSEVGRRTGTEWRVTATMIDLIPDSVDVKRTGIRFAVYKL